MDRIHRLAENTQGLQVEILRPIGPLIQNFKGFLVFHSFGGGTGWFFKVRNYH